MPKKIRITPNNEEKIWVKNLQKVREQKGITQVKLAMDAEVSQQSITFYESGSRVPSLDVAYRLAKVLDCSIDYLIGNDEKLVKAYYELGDKEYDSRSMIAADDNKK